PRVVVLGVARRVHECKRSGACCSEQRLHGRVLLQFDPVAHHEFVPARGIMSEPAAQLGSRGYCLAPLVESERALRNTAGPEAVDEYATPILRVRIVIHPAEAD